MISVPFAAASAMTVSRVSIIAPQSSSAKTAIFDPLSLLNASASSRRSGLTTCGDHPRMSVCPEMIADPLPARSSARLSVTPSVIRPMTTALKKMPPMVMPSATSRCDHALSGAAREG